MQRTPIPGLNCSQDQFEALHEATDKARKSSESVKVPRAALAALLMDHSKLIAHVELRP